MDISKMNKAEVLRCLYNNAKPVGMGLLHFIPDSMTIEEADALLKDQTYFDYIQGRVMKVELGGNNLETWLYNRDNGENAAEKALQHLAVEN